MNSAPPNRRRRAPITPVEYDAQGRPLCRNCGDPIPPTRRIYCCDPCHWEYMCKHSPEFAGLVFREKYGARCSGCGKSEDPLAEAYRRAQRVLAEVGLIELLAPFPYFQMDHIRPVADGGGSCGIENYRLLCVECHKKVTTTFAKDRASRRRETGPWKAATRLQHGYRVRLGRQHE